MSQPAQALSVRVESTARGVLIALVGRLDATTLAGAWEQTVGSLAKAPPKLITIDASGLDYCDGAGLGLFAELRRLAADAGGQVRFEHLSPELGRLVSMSLLDDPSATGLRRPPRTRFFTELGKLTMQMIRDQRQLIAFVGELTVALLWAVGHPHRVRYRDLARVARKAGADAVPVVCLLGLLIGVILSFQMADPLQRYGARDLIPNVVSYSLVRELGPLITAIILAGRSGAAFAAEIGTMKVTEELAALQTMGLDPARFLVVPRVLAAVIVTPLLAAFNILAGLVGSCLIMLSLNYTFIYYVHTVQEAVTPRDLIGGVVKALVFGLIVAGVGCLRGTQTRSGPGAVGDSTTRAVVAGIVLTIAADAVLGTLYYALGL